MELLFVYLWLKLDSIIGLSVVSIVILGNVLIGYYMFSPPSSWPQEEFKKKYKNYKRVPMVLIPVFLTIAIFTPSKTDMAVLVGSHFALQMSKTPEADKVISLLRKRANEILDAELKK